MDYEDNFDFDMPCPPRQDFPAMDEESFSPEDRESLIRWMQQRGGNREQAEFAAKQLMKRAAMTAREEGVAPIEAMGQLLTKIARAESVMSDQLGQNDPTNPPSSS